MTLMIQKYTIEWTLKKHFLLHQIIDDFNEFMWYAYKILNSNSFCGEIN